VPPLRIAILGGTGPQGRGLARRFAAAGHHVVLGSRDAMRAAQTAAALTDRLAGSSDAQDRGAHGSIAGADNVDAARDVDVLIVSVPHAAQDATLAAVEPAPEAVVVSCVNPLRFDDRGPVAVEVEAGSAAQEVALAWPTHRVTAAFHHLSAVSLEADGPLPDATVLVAGDDDEAVALVCELSTAVASRGGIHAGPLRNARHLEAMTTVLIDVNRRLRAHSGLAVTGLDGHP